MWGTHWGKSTIGLQAAVPKRPPHATFTFYYHPLLNIFLDIVVLQIPTPIFTETQFTVLSLDNTTFTTIHQTLKVP